MKFPLLAIAAISLASGILTSVPKRVFPRGDGDNVTAEVGEVSEEYFLHKLAAEFGDQESTSWEGVDGVQSLDVECRSKEVIEKACRKPIDVTMSKVVMEDQYYEMKRCLNATTRVTRDDSEKHGSFLNNDKKALTYESPRECNWRSNSGKQCLAYNIEFLSNGAVHFETVVENHSLESLKYGIACGILDGEGNLYTLARSGHLWGKLFKTSANNGEKQTRRDFVTNGDMRDNWKHIVAAVISCRKPPLVCKPVMATSILNNVNHHREWAKRSAMVKLDKEIEREYGPINRYIDLFI